MAGMYCVGCGNQLPDDAKFCSKCGRKTGADAAGAGPADRAAGDLSGFRELVKRGLDYTKAGGIAISVYKKKPREQHLKEAEEGYNGALAIIGQLEQHPLLKGRSQEERLKLMEGDLDLQKLISMTFTGLGALEYFRKNYYKCIESFQRVVNGGIPAGLQMKETLALRDGYLKNIRAEDFDAWVIIKKELLREEININELGFFEKGKYKG